MFCHSPQWYHCLLSIKFKTVYFNVKIFYNKEKVYARVMVNIWAHTNRCNPHLAILNDNDCCTYSALHTDTIQWVLNTESQH